MSTKGTDTAYGRQGGRVERWRAIPGPVVLSACGCGRSWGVPRDAEKVCDACGVRRQRCHEGVLAYAGAGPLPMPPAPLEPTGPRPAEPPEDWRAYAPPPETLAAARAALRRGAGPTEVAAHDRVLPHTGTQARRVLEALVAAPLGLTDDEILALGIVGPNAVRARRGRLVDDGWVAPAGFTRPNALGNDCTVWVAIPAAAGALAAT